MKQLPCANVDVVAGILYESGMFQWESAIRYCLNITNTVIWNNAKFEPTAGDFPGSCVK